MEEDINNSEATPEELIAEWQEPEKISEQFSPHKIAVIIGTAAGLMLLLIIIGIFQHDATFHLAALGVGVAAAAIILQNRNPAHNSLIRLTTARLIIDNQSYTLDNLLGFWLQEENDQLEITIELQKKSLVPLTILYKNTDQDEAREYLGMVISEIEPPLPTIWDKINQRFRI